MRYKVINTESILYWYDTKSYINEKGLAIKTAKPLKNMALPTGVEPVAFPLGGGRSIHLS